MSAMLRSVSLPSIEKGEIGACAIQEGFTYAVRSVDVEKVFNAAHRYKGSKSTSQ